MLIFLSDESKNDLADFWYFVHENAGQYGQDSDIAADKALEAFVARMQHLELFPESGRLRQEFGSGIRCLPIRGYLVFYQIRTEDILVVRVIHGSRDLENAWAGNP